MSKYLSRQAELKVDIYGNPFRVGDSFLHAVRDGSIARLKKETVVGFCPEGFPYGYKGRPIKKLERTVNTSALLRGQFDQNIADQLIKLLEENV